MSTTSHNLKPVLDELNRLIAEIRDADVSGVAATERQRVALVVLKNCKKLMTDLCESSPSPGYFYYNFD